jgi:hypothetical protein
MKNQILGFGLGLCVAACAPFAVAQSDADADAPPICRTALGTVSDSSQEDEGATVAARMSAICEYKGGLRTLDAKATANAAAAQERTQSAALLPGGKAPAGVPVWSSIGPARNNWWNNGYHRTSTNSGRVRNVLQDPTRPDRVYVLSAGGGLWRTDNFSNNKPAWTPLTDSAYSTSGGSFAFGASPDVLYLGIGDPFDATTSVSGVMLKSTDAGKTWSPFADLPGAIIVMDVKVDTSGGVDKVLVGTDTGLYRSADAGGTYMQMASAALDGRGVWSIQRSSRGWLAATQGGCQGNLGFCYGNGGIALSTDGGSTWSAVMDLPAAGRITLAVASPGEATVYAIAATADGSAQLDLFKSVDGGLTWTPLGITGKAPVNPNADVPTMDILSAQAWYNQLLLVDPRDPARNTVFLGGMLASALTRDGGATWTLISGWLGEFGLPFVHADLHTAAFISMGGAPAVVFGSDGGIFVTANDGKSFDDGKNDGLVTELLYAATAAGVNPSFILTGAQDNGTLLRIPNQPIWNGVIGGDGFGTGWSQANNAVSIGSLYNSRIWYSTVNPPIARSNWLPSHGILKNPDFYYFFTPVVTPTAMADPTGQTFFTKTGLRVYRTQDGAATWQAIGLSRFGGYFPNGNPGLTCQFNSNMMNMAVASANLNLLAVGCNAGLVAFTTDGGATWFQRSIRTLAPAYAGISSMTWGDGSTLYVGSITPGRPIVKSMNFGLTWTRATFGMPYVEVNKLLADWRDPTGNTVYAGTGLGVYRTTNGGASWSRFGAAMPLVNVKDLHMSADGKLLRAATYGRGVWELPL